VVKLVSRRSAGTEVRTVAVASMSSQRLSQMMDEYTGPIGLYSYLAAVGKVAPIILRRNLSYRRDAFEAERRRINADVGAASKTSAASSAKPEKTDAAQGESKERALDRTHDGDAPQESGHNSAGASGGSVAGGKRAPDGEQPCSRRSVHAVKKTAIVFRLRYQKGQQESVHRVPELRCPWCDMTCSELESLMWHLQASHDRFSYALDKSLAIPEIYINVKVSSATRELHKSLAPHTDFCFLSARRGGGSLSDSLSRLWACEEDAATKHDDGPDGANKKRKKGGDGSPGGKDGSTQGKYSAHPNKKVKGSKGKKGDKFPKKSLAERQLYRSQTCLPIDVNDDMDMDYDSDDDVDDEWQLAQVPTSDLFLSLRPSLSLCPPPAAPAPCHIACGTQG
jgi:hypothetical protein